MMEWRPFDARDRDPEVRKERVKLIANGFNAIGIALLLGSVVAPFLDPSRDVALWRILFGFFVSAALVLLANWVLRYIKPKE